MKKIIVIFFTLFSINLFCYQTELPDSSNKILNNLSDENKAILLQRWAWELRYTQQILALKYLKESIIISNKIKNYELEATSYNYMGVIFVSQNDHYNALKQYNQALEISEKNNIIKQIAYSKNNLGQLRLMKGDYKEAIKLMMESAEYHKINSDKLGIAYSYIRLCDAYLALKKYDSAYYYSNRSYEIRKEYANKQAIEKSQMSMGEALIGLGKSNEAIADLLTIDPLNQDKSLLYMIIARAYDSLNIINKQIHFLTLAKDAALSQKDYKNLMEASDFLVRAYFKKKDYISAEKVLFDISKFRDTLRNEEKNKQMQFLEFTYNFESQKSKNLDIDNQKNITFLILISISILLVLFFLIIYIILKYKLNKKSLLEKVNYYKSQIIELKDLNTELIIARDSLINLVSVDFNSYISNFRNKTEYLKKNFLKLESNQQYYYVDEINFLANRLSFVLENIITLTQAKYKLIQYDQVNFDLLFIINNIISSINLDYNKNKIEILNKIDKSLIVLEDLNISSIIIRNLLLFAIDNSPNDKKVLIEYKFNDKSEIVLSIKDYGEPLPRPILNKIKKNSVNLNEINQNLRPKIFGLVLVKDLIDIIHSNFWVDIEYEGCNSLNIIFNKGTSI